MAIHPTIESVFGYENKEYRKLKPYLESNTLTSNNIMFQKIFDSIMKFKTVEFDEIADTRGNISKYVGFGTISESLNILLELPKNTQVYKIADDIKTILDFLTVNTEVFTRAFSLENTQIRLIYNSTLFSITDAVSSLLSTQIDIMKSTTGIEVNVMDKIKGRPRTVFSIVSDTANNIKSGEMLRMLKTLENNHSRKNLVGIPLMTSAIVISGALAIIPLVRESLYLYYNTRVSISGYLEQQATLIEINRNKSAMVSLPAKEREKIVAKQEKAIKRFHQLSDLISVKSSKGEQKTNEDIKNENQSWSVDEFATEVRRNDRTASAIF